MCYSLQVLLFVCLTSSVVMAENILCIQSASEVSDPCKFECQFGYEREVALELERLSHENSRCRLNGIIVNLLPSIEFANGTIATRWFNGDVRIIQLEIDLSNIDDLQPCAFDSTAFRTIVKLTLRRMQIAQLQQDVFQGLFALRELYFHELMTTNFIPNWLINVGATLELLLVFGPAQPNYSLNGLTSDASMHALRFIHYSLNLNGTIDARTFHGLTSVETLELTGCSIEHIGAGAFDTLGTSLQLLKLDQNRLRQLPDGIFDRLLPSAGLTVFLDSNQWDCRCGLTYLQLLLQTHGDTFHGSLRCTTPLFIAGASIDETTFCVNGEDVVFRQQLQCQSRDRTNQTLAIELRQQHFKLLPVVDDLVVVRVRESSEPWMLVRLSVAGFAMLDSDANDWRMGCVWGTSTRHRIRPRLISKLAHVICMMNKTSETISPLDCTTFYQQPIVRPRKPWLNRTQKPTIATALAFVMMACFTVGAISIFAMLATKCDKRRDCVTNANPTHDSLNDPFYNDPDYYAELPYSVSSSSRRSSRRHSDMPTTVATRPQYMPTLLRSNSNPTLVYQSKFDVVPAARSNSLVYVYSSRFDVVPPSFQCGRRLSGRRLSTHF